jgi:hypothetical protein
VSCQASQAAGVAWAQGLCLLSVFDRLKQALNRQNKPAKPQGIVSMSLMQKAHPTKAANHVSSSMIQPHHAKVVHQDDNMSVELTDVRILDSIINGFI